MRTVLEFLFPSNRRVKWLKLHNEGWKGRGIIWSTHGTYCSLPAEGLLSLLLMCRIFSHESLDIETLAPHPGTYVMWKKVGIFVCYWGVSVTCHQCPNLISYLITCIIQIQGTWFLNMQFKSNWKIKKSPSTRPNSIWLLQKKATQKLLSCARYCFMF